MQGKALIITLNSLEQIIEGAYGTVMRIKTLWRDNVQVILQHRGVLFVLRVNKV